MFTISCLFPFLTSGATTSASNPEVFVKMFGVGLDAETYIVKASKGGRKSISDFASDAALDLVSFSFSFFLTFFFNF